MPEGVEAGSAKACFTADAYFREMFVRRDTSMAILSGCRRRGMTGLSSDDADWWTQRSASSVARPMRIGRDPDAHHGDASSDDHADGDDAPPTRSTA